MSYVDRHTPLSNGLAAATVERMTLATKTPRSLQSVTKVTPVVVPVATKAKLRLLAGPGKFTVTKDAPTARANGVSYPMQDQNLRTIHPSRLTDTRNDGINDRSVVATAVKFPPVKPNVIAPVIPPAKDRIILGPTETAATLTNQAQNDSPLTLSIVPPPPATKIAVDQGGLVTIVDKQPNTLTESKYIAPAEVVGSAQTDTPPAPPVDEATLGWPMIALLVGVGVMILRRGK